MLELDDIQHILMTRPHSLTARYEFLSFDNPAGGRAWLTELLDRCHRLPTRWPPGQFPAVGDGGIHVERTTGDGRDEEAMATFPDEFRKGMAARAAVLGDTGPNHPDNWVGGLAGNDLHAIVILFADEKQRERSAEEHAKLAARATACGCCPAWTSTPRPRRLLTRPLRVP